MNLLSEYCKYGFALIPIPQGSKGPVNKGWNEKENVITNPIDAINIKHNVGLAHLYCNSYTTATLDIDDYDLSKKWLAEHDINLDELLDADDAVQINSGRPGRSKLLYKLPHGSPQMLTQQITDPKSKSMVLEFRCASANGKTVQDLLPPSIHPDTHKPYTWGGKGNWKNIPTMPLNLLMVWKRKINLISVGAPSQISTNPLIGHVNEITIQHLRSALNHLRSDNREVWIKIGMALKPLGDIGRGLWLNWSMTSDKYDAHDASKTWDSFAPEKLDYRFVFAEAQRQGWVNPTKKIIAEPLTEEVKTVNLALPKKLPGQLKPVVKLDPNHLPSSIKDAVVDIAERLSCPVDYVAISVIVGAGAVLGNSIGILPKEFDSTWIVHSGFWGGIVGLPGSMKTPSLNASLKPLYHLEEQAGIQYSQDLIQYKKDKTKFDNDLSAFKSGKSTIFPVEPIEPVKKRYIVNDATYQALGEIISKNPEGVLALSDELSGLLQSLDTAGQEAARGFYLSGWGGNSNYTFDRVSRGSITLSRYLLSVFGGFQPDRIKAYVRFAQSGSSKNDGLLQRFQLLVWPDLDEEFKLVDRVENKIALQKMHQAMINLRPNVRPERPTLIHFDKEAQTLFNQWYVQNEKFLRNEKLTSSEHSHFAKYRSLIPGLALLFHKLDNHEGNVCLECLASSLNFAHYLKSHAERIYASVYGHDFAPARALARKLLSGVLEDGFTARTVYLKGWSNLSKDETYSALDVLVEYGWLKELVTDSIGRKTTRYYIHPDISEAFL
jgi:putative DNA primase/helicase